MMWVRNYERSGNNPLAIVDKHRVGKRVKRLRNEAEKIVWQVLKREYFTTKQQINQACSQAAGNRTQACLSAGNSAVRRSGGELPKQWHAVSKT